MILRLSEKLRAKIKVETLRAMPLDENPYADWSAQLFIADRTSYIILSNTKSLYSIVLYAKGCCSDGRFIERALSNLREFMQADCQEFAYLKLVAPSSGSVHFAKALDRTVTCSMNELIIHAKAMLVENELSPFDVGFKLNEVLLSAIASSKSEKYGRPRDAFKALAKTFDSENSMR